MSAPEAACARAISGKLRYLPVPTMRREWKGRPAITSWSDMEILNSILDPRATRNKSRRTVSQNHTAQEGRITKWGQPPGCAVYTHKPWQPGEIKGGGFGRCGYLISAFGGIRACGWGRRCE